MYNIKFQHYNSPVLPNYSFPCVCVFCYSFGWLRLLHHCISVSGEGESELKQNIVTAAAEVDGLLSACCSLLLIPASSLIMPCLERVLYTLGLHDSQMGLQMIDTLLNNGAVPFHQGNELYGNICMPVSV